MILQIRRSTQDPKIVLFFIDSCAPCIPCVSGFQSSKNEIKCVGRVLSPGICFHNVFSFEAHQKSFVIKKSLGHWLSLVIECDVPTNHFRRRLCLQFLFTFVSCSRWLTFSFFWLKRTRLLENVERAVNMQLYLCNSNGLFLCTKISVKKKYDFGVWPLYTSLRVVPSRWRHWSQYFCTVFNLASLFQREWWLPKLFPFFCCWERSENFLRILHRLVFSFVFRCEIVKCMNKVSKHQVSRLVCMKK